MSSEKWPTVAELIPHRQTMKLIDEIIHLDPEERRLTAMTKVQADWPLSDGCSVGATLMIELIAQTVACRHSWDCRQNRRKPKVGLLVGIKKAEFLRPGLPVGAELMVKIEHLYGTWEYGAYAGQVFLENEIVGQATIQVLSPEDESVKDILSGTTDLAIT